MTTTNNQLNFLQEKIQEIGSAIFFNLSDSVLKLPTSIVTTLQVDEYGYVWFFVQKPKQQLNEFETEFPARLDFFKKGKNCYLQVMGKAWVVSDPEEVNSFVTLPEDAKDIALNQMVLIKVKMLKAEYHETQTRVQNSWWQNAASNLYTWFRSGGYKGTSFYPAS
jgi:hypothetical protein